MSLGLADGVPGVAWPAVRHDFGQPLGALGLLLITDTVGYFASSFGSGWVVARLGVGGVLSGSGALIAVGLIGYAVAPLWGVMVGYAVFAGLGAGAIDAALNVYAARHFAPRTMVWLHGCWGVGALLGPLIMTAAIGSAHGWRAGYLALAAIIGAITLVVAPSSGRTMCGAWLCAHAVPRISTWRVTDENCPSTNASARGLTVAEWARAQRWAQEASLGAVGRIRLALELGRRTDDR